MTRRVRGRAQTLPLLTLEGPRMYEVVSWEEVHKMSLELAKAIGDSVDAVVGLLRGGYVPAHLIADALGLELYVMRIKSYRGIGKKGKPVVTLPLIGNVTDLRILLVDDVCDSGETLSVAKKFLEAYSPKSITTAVLFKKPQCSEEVDLWVKESGNWIVFPWDASETLREDPSVKGALEEALGVELDILGEGGGSGEA
ncbi:phosphoribosyltransferase [Ignicoccus hospitalis KIN4/I]|uniref:Phosphoribosyltransferase n=2 Tax=Ignicoccus TaxID=54258 RepID=A8A915_IGNH4|nr:phosphoribosyltransferase [Ignicoccus hospitalis KIN4/I]